MKKWVIEVKESLDQALALAEEDSIPEENLYKLVPVIYSDRQKTNDETLLSEIVAANEEQVARDWSVDEHSKKQFKFHFVSSYLFGFVVAGKITEMRYDRIMDQACNKLDLFVEEEMYE